MRVGIDYTAAVCQQAGIGRYTRQLVRALVNRDRENSYKLFVAGSRTDDLLGAWPPNVQIRSLPVSDRWLSVAWQRLRLPIPIQAVIGPIDLFHSPDFVLPPTGRVPAVLTVHDLSFLRVPQFFVPGFRDYLERAVSRAVRRSAHILADSASTRADLIDLLDVSPESVSVLYPGVDPRFQPVTDTEVLERVRARYRLPGRFILGVGTLQPRKNFTGLIESFARLLGVYSHSQCAIEAGRATTGNENRPELYLVISGGRGWMGEEIPVLIRRLGLEGRVLLTGFVADEDLPALYSLAEILAFPSWYEGFGLPVLEAMACGTPVVSADNSSLPEVVGEAGLLVPAGNPDALTGALARLLQDNTLHERLSRAGRMQAGRFTWEAAAEQLEKVYRNVLGI